MNAKRILCALLALALCGSFAACNRSGGQSSQQQTPPVPEASASESIPEESPSAVEEPSVPDNSMVPGPADTSMYRGVIAEISTEEDAVTVFLEQAPGTDFGAAKLTVTIPKDTLSNAAPTTLTVGDYLEVYYGVSLESSGIPDAVEAVAFNRLPSADLSLFNGTIKEITPNADQNGGDLLLTSLEGEQEILFHYDQNTQFYLDFDALAEGDKLNVYFNGATTRSIPPQATAMEVRAYPQ